MNKFCLVIACLSVLMASGGCDKNGPHFLGRYQLNGTDDHRYLVDTQHNEIVIDEHVLDVEIRQHYLLVLREWAQSYECGPIGQKTIFTDYSGKLEYWVIDGDSGEKVGPLDMSGYTAFLKSHALASAELKQSSYYVPPIVTSQLQKSCEPVWP